MSAESTLYGWLAAHAALTTLVGGAVTPRIYPDVVPGDQALPAVAYARSGTEPITTIHGTIAGRFVDLQVQCWAETRPEAEAVADAVEGALLAAGELSVNRAVLFDTESGNYGTSIDVRLLVN